MNDPITYLWDLTAKQIKEQYLMKNQPVFTMTFDDRTYEVRWVVIMSIYQAKLLEKCLGSAHTHG